MKKYFVSIRLLTVKNNSHTDLRNYTVIYTVIYTEQLFGIGSQYREEDPENKIL